jgi:cyclic beta-1,2-glucan synthetase
MYRAGLERILGFRVRGATLLLDPCVPSTWRGFEIDFRHRSARYHIVVDNPQGKVRGIASLRLDGSSMATTPAVIPLVDDGSVHDVHVVLG